MPNVAATLEALIRHRSDAQRGDEPALARFLGDALWTGPFRPDELCFEEVPRATPATPGAFVYARWGKPRLLINAHLDTVPPNDSWTSDPFVPRVENNRVIGLGAADTKGAIAAILCALHDESPADMAVLFSGDEECSTRCVNAFLAGPLHKGIEQAIVCEPTRMRVGTRHRGVLALDISIQGPGGHSSRADTTRAPLAELARLATAYSDWGRRQLPLGPPGFKGMCVNVARLDGGIAFNVIPARGLLTVSFRCPPNADPRQLRAEVEAIARAEIPDARIDVPTDHPPFHTRDLTAYEPWLGATIGDPIDLGFWTEAALYSEAGIDAVVIGPGDIAQAHGPDEWVEIEQLEQARRLFAGVLRESRLRDGASSRHGSR